MKKKGIVLVVIMSLLLTLSAVSFAENETPGPKLTEDIVVEEVVVEEVVVEEIVMKHKIHKGHGHHKKK